MDRKEAYSCTFRFFKTVTKLGLTKDTKRPNLLMWLKVRELLFKKLGTYEIDSI